jgi:Ca2+-binding EF-hand superfamily protein
VTYKEIEEMIRTVDRNGDGRISYSEFRLAREFDSSLSIKQITRRAGSK